MNGFPPRAIGGLPLLVFLLLPDGPALRAEVRLNEFVAEHVAVEEWPGAPKDIDGAYPDWLELYNVSGTANWKAGRFPAKPPTLSSPTPPPIPTATAARTSSNTPAVPIPRTRDAPAFPAFALESVAAQTYGVVRYRYRPAAEDAVLTPQTSADLAAWTATGLTSLAPTHQADGSLSAAWRSSTSSAQDPARFFRIKATYQP